MVSKSILGLAALAIVAFSSGVSAQPQQTTKYSYYFVRGDSVEDVYSAMLHEGPRVRGAKAYAATSATTTQDGKLRQGGSCQVENYKLKLDFVIKLPKLKNEKSLPASDRSQWQRFSAFLKKHEETHRSIWLGCAADLEAKVRALKAGTCADVDSKAQALWDKMRAACSKKHAAFDAAEQKKLMKHPFVRLVYKRTVQVHAANAP